MSLYGESKDAKRLQVDATSLADLKAELFRKKGEAVKNKQKGNYRPEKVRETKTNIWSKENTGLIARIQKDIEKKKEDERTEARVKSQLEKKARLYSSLKAGKGRSSVGENFLVQFGANSDSEEGEFTVDKEYPAGSREEEWVEYTDTLGRTRNCMRKDLPSLKRQDKDLKRDEDEDREVETGQGLKKEAPDLLNEQMRLDMLRQKWEEQEMENLTKDAIHYTDVRFDEARAHGAGFYAFSNDGDKRTGEQATLRKLHEETDEMRKQKERKAEKRKKEMNLRMKKVKAKRREKMGLPPLESASESEEEEKKANSDSDDGAAEDISKSVLEGLKMFRNKTEESERKRNELKRVAGSHTRDWDQNKEQQEELEPRKEWRVMDQREWVEKKRVERKNDFAPPSNYGNSAYIEARFELKRKEDEARAAEAKRKKFNANSWKDNLGGATGPSVQTPPQSNYSEPLEPVKRSNTKFPAQMPPGFSQVQEASLNRGPSYNLEEPPPNTSRPASYETSHFVESPPNLEVPPPTTHASSGPGSSSQSEYSMQPPAASSNWGVPPAGHGEQLHCASIPQGPKECPLPLDPTESHPGSSMEGPLPQYSKMARLELHKRMKAQDFMFPPGDDLATRIINELDERGESSDDEDEQEEDKSRGRGAEFAPPIDMEYYGAGQGKRDHRQGFRSHEEMADSFNAGLKAAKGKKS